MRRRRCGRRWCWRRATEAIRTETQDDDGRKHHYLIAVCERHAAQMVAWAAERDVPVVDHRPET